MKPNQLHLISSFASINQKKKKKTLNHIIVYNCLKCIQNNVFDYSKMFDSFDTKLSPNRAYSS